MALWPSGIVAGINGLVFFLSIHGSGKGCLGACFFWAINAEVSRAFVERAEDSGKAGIRSGGSRGWLKAIGAKHIRCVKPAENRVKRNL